MAKQLPGVLPVVSAILFQHAEFHEAGYAESEFRRTRNPVYAWDVIAQTLARGLPLPEWTKEYLLDAAAAIARLSRDEARKPRKGHPARAIAQAFGFGRRGRANPFDAMGQTAHELMIAFDVYECHTRNWANQRRGLEGTTDWNTVYSNAAAAHYRNCQRCRRAPSVKTVERYWRKHALSIIPPHLIDRAKSHKVADILR